MVLEIAHQFSMPHRRVEYEEVGGVAMRSVRSKRSRIDDGELWNDAEDNRSRKMVEMRLGTMNNDGGAGPGFNH